MKSVAVSAMGIKCKATRPDFFERVVIWGKDKVCF